MSIRCPVCGERFETEAELERHDHALPEAWRKTGAGFTCPVCGRDFSEEEDLVAHQSTAHPAAAGG